VLTEVIIDDRQEGGPVTGLPGDGEAGGQPEGSTGTPPSKKRPTNVQELLAAIDSSACNKATKKALDALLHDASDLKQVSERITKWFAGPMDMVRAKYKGLIGTVLFFTALAACISLNLDTIMIGGVLWSRCELRANVEAAAARVTERLQAEEVEELPHDAGTLLEAATELKELDIPIGWSSRRDDPRSLPGDFQGWLMKVLGLAATVVAASLGAPFWFDMLNRLIGLRKGRTG
jgi:hypothetical protein